VTITYTFLPHVCPEEEGLYCPQIVCDACGKPIRDHGNTYWVAHADGTPAPGVWHTHKGVCARFDDEIKRRHGREDSVVMWEEVDRWLKQLAHNLHRPLPQLRHAVARAPARLAAPDHQQGEVP